MKTGEFPETPQVKLASRGDRDWAEWFAENNGLSTVAALVIEGRLEIARAEERASCAAIARGFTHVGRSPLWPNEMHVRDRIAELIECRERS